MRLFSYYALHTFKNQLKKLFKTWILIFFVVCIAIGAAIGLFISFLDDSAGQKEPEGFHQEMSAETEESPSLEDFEADGEEPFLPESADMEAKDIIELVVGGIVLFMFVFYAIGADKNGSRIFLPADVNLLFASPMKPQSVLMFRVATQLGIAVLGSVYMLFQLPNLIFNAGLSTWAALALIVAWGVTIVFGTLIQVLLYTLSATYPAIKRFLRPAIYGVLLLVAGSFLIFSARSGDDYLKAAFLFFNAPGTRFIPIWGWIKGFCGFAMEGSLSGAALCLLALVLGGALLIWVIWNLHADFYEDAMAKSEETAELLEKAQSEKSSGIVVKRTKDRSEKLQRDGMRHGAGANVFFFKSIYNRFRFAHLGFFTKTMETYLAAAVFVSLLCRFVTQTEGVLPVALTLAVMSFFRSLGNPLEQDTKMDSFLLIPESTWAKLFWSLMGGTVNCLLDVLPAVIVGALLTGTNPLAALIWVPVIVSVDFYATNVGTFIGLSVPVSAGKTVKQVVQIMFVYFGLLPDIAVASLGIVSGHTMIGMTCAAVLNFGLGFLFFGLSPVFIDPRGGKMKENPQPFQGDLKLAKRHFSIVGLGLTAILAVTSALQIAAGSIVGSFYPQGDSPSWVLWLCTFAPMYLVGVPIGILILKRVPSVPREKHVLKPGKFAVAAIISIFAMYAGNLAGNLILALIQAVSGSSSANPVLTYAMDDSLWMRILFMVLLAPAIEEYIFRKQLIDRTCIYGEKLAVVTSAFVFGLFHGNLSQFFYAFALGIIFGYIYLKTGKLRYSMALHMMINFMGSVLAPALLNSVQSETLGEADLGGADPMEEMILGLLPFVIYVLALIALSLAGLVLFCINVRNVSFQRTEFELTKGMKLKTVYCNLGMGIFVVSSLVMILLSFFA